MPHVVTGKFITSEYWLKKEELVLSAFEGTCLLSEVEEEE